LKNRAPGQTFRPSEIWTSLGTYDAASKTFTFTGEGVDPHTGQPMKSRDVTRFVSADKQVVEMYKKPPRRARNSRCWKLYTRARS